MCPLCGSGTSDAVCWPALMHHMSYLAVLWVTVHKQQPQAMSCESLSVESSPKPCDAFSQSPFCCFVLQPKLAGLSCNDGNPCTSRDVCSGAGYGPSHCAGTPKNCGLTAPPSLALRQCYDVPYCDENDGTCVWPVSSAEHSSAVGLQAPQPCYCSGCTLHAGQGLCEFELGRTAEVTSWPAVCDNIAIPVQAVSNTRCI